MSHLLTIVVTSILTTVAYMLVADLVVRPWIRRRKAASLVVQPQADACQYCGREDGPLYAWHGDAGFSIACPACKSTIAAATTEPLKFVEYGFGAPRTGRAES